MLMKQNRYHIEERAEVRRVYEVLAEDENAAMDQIDNGTATLLSVEDVESHRTVTQCQPRRAGHID